MSTSERTLHVLTAVTRPSNLPTVGRWLDQALAAGWQPVWHLLGDSERRHVGGQALKNAMLDQIEDGWVFVLDDDTLAVPSLFARLGRLLAPDVAGFVVGQSRADGRRLHAAPENVRVGDIDIGQAILRRSLIGEARIPLSYEGDGLFLERVLRGRRDIVYLDEPLSLHNALEGMVPFASARYG